MALLFLLRLTRRQADAKLSPDKEMEKSEPSVQGGD